MKSKQTNSTSSLKNRNLSLATFKGSRARKFAKLKLRDFMSDITDISVLNNNMWIMKNNTLDKFDKSG